MFFIEVLLPDNFICVELINPPGQQGWVFRGDKEAWNILSINEEDNLQKDKC